MGASQVPSEPSCQTHAPVLIFKQSLHNGVPQVMSDHTDRLAVSLSLKFVKINYQYLTRKEEIFIKIHNSNFTVKGSKCKQVFWQSSVSLKLNRSCLFDQAEGFQWQQLPMASLLPHAGLLLQELGMAWRLSFFQCRRSVWFIRAYCIGQFWLLAAILTRQLLLVSLASKFHPLLLAGIILFLFFSTKLVPRRDLKLIHTKAEKQVRSLGGFPTGSLVLY